MSNYVYLIAAPHLQTALSPFLSTFSADETCTFPLGRGYTLTFLGRGPRPSIRPDGSVFLGYAINHARREIWFDPQPDQLGADDLEGCFFSASLTQRAPCGISLRGDVFGQLPILYTAGNDFFACSDSLLGLTEVRRALGLPNSLNEPLFMARASVWVVGDQLLNTQTFVNDITYNLPGGRLDVSWRDERIVCSASHGGAPAIFSARGAGYEEALREAAASMTGLLAGLLSVEVPAIRFDLSGGQDSRLVLAAALAGKENLDRIHIQSSQTAVEDMEIAKQIADATGLVLNAPPRDGEKPSVRIPLAPLWYAASGGIYDALYAANSRIGDEAFFLAGGHGAESLKGNYNWRSVNAMARDAAPVVQPFLRAALRSGLEALSIDPDAPGGGEWHYLGYRNALHGSRLTNATIYALRPLLDRLLVGAAHQRFGAQGKPATPAESMIADLLIHISPDLAALPFDQEKKALDARRISDRLAVLGRLGPVEPYKVIGKPSPTMGGPLSGLLHRARATGFRESAFTQDTVTALINQAREHAPAELRAYIGEMADACIAQMQTPLVSNTRPARAAGKLMSLMMVS